MTAPVTISAADARAMLAKPAKRPAKYRNAPIIVDGIRFDSKAEAKQWEFLRLLERAGLIRDLSRQVRFRLDFNGIRICDYVADFCYFDLKLGRNVVEDVKGLKTPAYRIKAKLMLACHGITISEVAA